MFNRLLDHLEEWLISALMAAATLVAFTAVAMRYTTGSGISWAQELTIYLFIWMAKFGAAYGVRTGIHIGVDFVVNAANPAIKRILIISAMSLGVTFTSVIAFFGARWVIFIYGTGQVSPDLEWPMWIIYLAIPLGSSLMCYRFVQAMIFFLKTGQLHSHYHGTADTFEEEQKALP
ncbi:MAG: TRAP transporter small permease [Pseudomonadota bacterium]|nr:TRAP transporter small permease [Gammaproteobacteria bacterium]MBU1731784.1 TRAP transporter small permease [Gammaproteobacteria bacterium]MBU1892608.1 TRAP transporter small permease [Gammaproteobacteria bacterium]